MLDILAENPWLILAILGFAIPILAIVFGKVTSYLVRVRQLELETRLKQDMLQRGMSAEDIRTSSRPHRSQGARQVSPLLSESNSSTAIRLLGSGVVCSRPPGRRHLHGKPALDSDLARILDRWPNLPAPIRAAMLAMVASACPDHKAL